MGESKKSFWLATITGFIIVVVCELIGQHTLKMGKVSIVLFPMLYAVLIGLFITPDLLGSKITALKKVIGEKEINLAGDLVGITLIVLGIKYGSTVGPNIQKILMAGPAFVFTTIFFACATIAHIVLSIQGVI
ncbi:MAG: DUF3100 domain-containing protein [Anaerotignaceae bacterium]